MHVIEYGSKDQETILLLHGGGLSWWNYREEAELLSDRFHVVLPVLDGHANSDADFTSIEENASRIISYIDQTYGGSVLLIGGLSLGAQILVEILSQRGDICRYAIIESASV
ncbi:MAG: alpha/beta hydrolase, partial [Clostridia bacterium]|nr:alpha/beta hydrolase [Clostridia bacterium]